MSYFDKFKKGKYKGKNLFGKFWYFIWHEDSMESWMINIVLAFILIKYLVYPGLGFVFATTHPIVAVVSGSMYHGNGFDDYWINGGGWYDDNGVSKSLFNTFPMRNGFSKGDIMVLRGVSSKDLEIGDIIVFISAQDRPRPDPIIHRIVAKNEVNGEIIFGTKGDNYRTNNKPINGCDFNGCLYESDIKANQIIGKAFIRVPYLGYVKIWAVDFACMFNDFNFCIKR